MTEQMHTISLMTVPHTGAHFTAELLSTFDLQYTANHWGTAPGMLPEESKIIISARDPYLIALRYIANGDAIEDVALSFDTCFSNMYNIDYYVVDVGCREADRLEHVSGMARFLGLVPENHAEKLVPFVEAWKPSNTTEDAVFRGAVAPVAETNRAEYLESGSLPQGYDWSVLDTAVEWYKTLLSNDYV